MSNHITNLSFTLTFGFAPTDEEEKFNRPDKAHLLDALEVSDDVHWSISFLFLN